ncbi:MAG: sigma-70 family RNA polymerase sigma factor [Phycisphaeraceae bacterium]|nr:sigma-70 family RNA polymerase sigma factor [Phycisphaeraceae bacterium]MBX3406855.1 sigma-70 family RNA polymerase sigma factor [Phycisphaeraceae bacterium]
MPERSSTTTRATLLSRVRDGADSQAWVQFDALYRDMLVRFCRSRGLQHADAEDAVQLVFSKLTTGIRNFEYRPARGRFRDYLFRCVRSAISDLLGCPKSGANPVVQDGEAGDAGNDAELAAAFEREWVDHHVRVALSVVSQRVDDQSVAVLRASMAGRSVPEIAADLGMSADAVYKARQRMRTRLREQVAAQLREEEESVDA